MAFRNSDQGAATGAGAAAAGEWAPTAGARGAWSSGGGVPLWTASGRWRGDRYDLKERRVVEKSKQSHLCIVASARDFADESVKI